MTIAIINEIYSSESICPEVKSRKHHNHYFKLKIDVSAETSPSCLKKAQSNAISYQKMVFSA